MKKSRRFLPPLDDPSTRIIRSFLTAETKPITPAVSSAYFGVMEISETEVTSEVDHRAEGDFQTIECDAFLAASIRGRNLQADLAAAADWNGGNGLFFSWRDKIQGPLAAGYPLYLRLLAEGNPAIDAVLRHPYFGSRDRLPSRRNPAHIVLLLVAKPEDEGDRKHCSEYSPIYQYAAQQEIRPAEFADRICATTLAECTEAVRIKRPAKQAVSTDAVRSEVDLAACKYRLLVAIQDGGQPVSSVVIPLTEKEKAALTGIIKSNRENRTAYEVIDAVRNALQPVSERV